ncbi:AAA family ATPase [Mycobacterium sp. E342]|uniref:nucleotide-binding protein n=1 Tax=Mycobacterium sp. E342 TaxID=1834147 RepID=UPI001E3A8BF6|nr:AAA family ATPase [Mycobacterium sp. E342]
MTRINPGLSPDEKYELELYRRIRRNPSGSHRIAVVGLKGGAGKTTLTVALGSVLAQVRSDRILAFDADADSGNLADRAGRRSGSTVALGRAGRHGRRPNRRIDVELRLRRRLIRNFHSLEGLEEPVVVGRHQTLSPISVMRGSTRGA